MAVPTERRVTKSDAGGIVTGTVNVKVVLPMGNEERVSLAFRAREIIFKFDKLKWSGLV